LSETLDPQTREALRKLAVPDIIEIADPTASMFQKRGIDAAEKQRQAAIKQMEDAVEKKAREDANVLRSRAQDELHARGWWRFPKNPREQYFSLNVDCPYGCNEKVAMLKTNTPNRTPDDYPFGTPLSMSEVSEDGNHTTLHNCILKIKKNSELQYIIRRMEHLENENRLLRNSQDRHSKDDSRHRGLN
jgi:hypothetical protein